MSGVPQSTLNWLYERLTNEYLDPNRTYSEVAGALSQNRSFELGTLTYTYENGQSALLLRLKGTIPVTFRGVVYRFPVEIWIPHAYPREAPLVYVTPPQDMMIRVGQHVSTEGRVYHPYLAQWGQSWDRSSLSEFLEVLRGVFAKEPPVIAKQQVETPPPVPPPPEDWRNHIHRSPKPTGEGPQPPPKPPKPFPGHDSAPSRPGTGPELPPKPHYSPQPGRDDNDQRSPWQQVPQNPYIPQQLSNLNLRRQPSLPPQPPPLQTYPHDYRPPIPGYQYIDSPVSPITPIIPHKGQLPHFPQQVQYHQTQRVQAPGPLPPQPHLSSQNQSGHTWPSGQPQQPYRGQQILQQPVSQPKAPIPDLLDAPLDVTLPSQNSAPLPAPPIPPNPEKDALLRALSSELVARLSQTINANTSALPALRSQQIALQTASQRLSSELTALTSLDGVLTTNERVLREAMIEADRVMNVARARRAPDVDDVLVAPTLVAGQLYSLCAEEKACEDALFVLGRGLDKGRVGAAEFIRLTRSLARERFLKKALIKKIAMGMGLEEGAGR